MAQKSSLWRALRAYQIYGANTNVGKTIMSTILCKGFLQKYPQEVTHYLKPVSTGPLSEADDRHISRFAPRTKTSCLFQFDEAVSPHIAARSKPPLPDADILDRVLNHFQSCSLDSGTILVETAGGVHSPTPSGTSQADLYRPLRLPICLVADHRLGGISATISAFESLHVRGYDLEAVLQFKDDQYQNHEYLSQYFGKKDIPTLSLPLPPPQAENEQEDFERLSEYYERISKYDEMDRIITEISENHEKRIQRLEEMPSRAYAQIWYPFTQHAEISADTILTIDSASGDFFSAHKKKDEGKEMLIPTFDGSASWWTQGLGHGNPDLSLAAAYAAGRYGHVMFAGAVNEPALSLASSLLSNMQNPRLSKVFYSDNGSTGMEVATKMALTAACSRYNWDVKKGDVGILGLKGSYHGDTIGCMDASEPSTYNEKVHWYEGRGYWFDFPQVKMVNGEWIVGAPADMEDVFGEKETFTSLGDIFDISARYESEAGERYRSYIKETLERLINVEGKTFGALIMEPVLLGAGGMLFADPLFQHCLVQVVRSNSHIFGQAENPTNQNAWTGLPVVFDEVFTGLYRLGRFSAASFLQTHPDISCHAKLLTGGLVPLCTTLASDSIYNAFLSSEKSDALLHGHSYTAHAVGCHVANTSLKTFMDMDRNGQWQQYKDSWKEEPKTTGSGQSTPETWSMWSKDFVKDISNKQEVDSVIALGSVLAIEVHDQEGTGYTSFAAIGLREKLLEGSSRMKIHSRVLGNMLYLMASQTSTRETLADIENLLVEALT